MRRIIESIVLIGIITTLISCSNYYEEAISRQDQITLATKEFKVSDENTITYLAFTENQMVIVKFDNHDQRFVDPIYGPYKQIANRIYFPQGMPGRSEIKDVEFSLEYGMLTLKLPEEEKTFGQL